MVAPAEGKTLVSWGTPTVQVAWAAPAWPRVYRERNAIQEHSVKRMMDHGALTANYGRKKRGGPDRHQHRAGEQLAQSLRAAQQRVAKQAEAVKAPQAQVATSTSRGHGKRLGQRQRA